MTAATDSSVASMDDEGNSDAFTTDSPFHQAIDCELLADYQVVVVGVTDSEAHALAARGAFVTHDGQAVTDWNPSRGHGHTGVAQLRAD